MLEILKIELKDDNAPQDVVDYYNVCSYAVVVDGKNYPVPNVVIEVFESMIADANILYEQLEKAKEIVEQRNEVYAKAVEILEREKNGE